MISKSIAILDITNSSNQFYMSLMFTSILSKKYQSGLLANFDMPINLLFKDINLQNKKNSYLVSNLFNCEYYELINCKDDNKIKEIINGKNDFYVINCSSLNKINWINNMIYVIFIDIKSFQLNELVKLYLDNDLCHKQVYLFIYNATHNIQCEKIYLEILKQFKYKCQQIIKLNVLPCFSSLSSIETIDPWDDLYQKIKNIF